jgi:LysM repeat protein
MKIKFKIPKLPGKKKRLRATAARRPLRIAAADYDDMSEPNMKLSRALLIVLVLHIVAVSGIIAFNAIKTRQGAETVPINPVSAPVASVPPAIKTETATVHRAGPVVETKPARTAVKPVSKPADDTHKTYTVAKGDNPVAIAKKLKVSYDELLSLNHIDDPRKLQIGQKLLIPNKTTTKGKKGEE